MMKKSLLTASVIGAISAAVSGVASADNMFYAANSSSTYCKPGFYAGVQGGRSDTFYKTNDIFSAEALGGGSLSSGISPFSSVGLPPVINDESGDPFFIDGAPSVSSSSSSALVNQHIDDIGIGGRIYAGYQFNPYFALETGYTQYAKTSFNTNQSVNAAQISSAPYREPEDPNPEATGTQVQSFDGSNYYAGDVTEHAVDLVAKATLPLQAGFGLYADAGLAFVQANRYINSFGSNGTLTTTTIFQENDEPVPQVTSSTANVSSSGVDTVFDKTYQAVRPVVGAGIDYTLPGTNVDISVFYNRLFGNNDNGVGIPDASLWGLGAGYKFA